MDKRLPLVRKAYLFFAFFFFAGFFAAFPAGFFTAFLAGFFAAFLAAFFLAFFFAGAGVGVAAAPDKSAGAPFFIAMTSTPQVKNNSGGDLI
jgi:hypothetical protein